VILLRRVSTRERCYCVVQPNRCNLNPIAGIGGTLAGAVITGAITLLRDRLEWTRRVRTRWDEARREIYVPFLHAAHEVWREGHLAPYGFHARLKSGEADRSHEALAELRRATDEMWRHFRELELVASRSVIEAAREIARTVSDIAARTERTISEPTEETLQHSTDAEAAAAAAFERFKALVRHEIAIGAAAETALPRA